MANYGQSVLLAWTDWPSVLQERNPSNLLGRGASMTKQGARYPHSTKQADRASPLSSSSMWFARAGRPIVLPGITLPARPGLLVFSMILLIGLLSVVTTYETARRA